MDKWSNEDVTEWLKSLNIDISQEIFDQWRRDDVSGRDLEGVNEFSQFKPPNKFKISKLLLCQRLFDALVKERQYKLFDKELQKRKKKTTPIPLIPDVTVDEYFVDYQEQKLKFKEFLEEFVEFRDKFHNTLTTFEFKEEEREQLLLYVDQRMKAKRNIYTHTDLTYTENDHSPQPDSSSGFTTRAMSPLPLSPSSSSSSTFDFDDVSPAAKKHRVAMKHFMKKLFDSNQFFIQDSDISKLKAFSESNLTIAVIGDMRAGKSSFINALLGTELLPVDEVPCTSAICRIRYSETKHAIIHYSDTSKPPFEIDLSNEPSVPKEFISQSCDLRSTSNPFDYSLVEIYWPIPFLSRAIEIIDTPGFNENTYLTELVREFLPQANAIVCLVNSSQTMTDSLSSGLEVIKHECGISSEIFVVANKFDAVADEDKDKVREFIFQRASAQFPTLKSKRQILFHTISSKNVLEQVKNDRPIDPSFTNLATSLVEFIRMSFHFKIWAMLQNLEAQLDTCKRVVNDSLKSTVGSHQFAQEIISIILTWHHDSLRYLKQVKLRLTELIHQFWASMTPVIERFIDRKMNTKVDEIIIEDYEQITQVELIEELERNLSNFLNEHVKRELEIHKFKMLNVEENEDLRGLLDYYLAKSTMNNIAFSAHKQNLIDTLSVVLKFKKLSTVSLTHLFSSRSKSFKLIGQTSTQIARKIVDQQLLEKNVSTLLSVCIQPLEELIQTMRGQLENMFTFEFVQLANPTDNATDRIQEDYAKLGTQIERIHKKLQAYKKDYFLQKYLVDIDNEVKIVKHVDREYERTFTEGTFNGETVTVSYYNVTKHKELIEAYVLNEIVVLSRLRHESIVEFKGAGIKGNIIYIINNYCPKTLRKYLRTQDRYFRTPESLSRKLDILIQIARGMEYLHCHNIIHGDLSTHIVWQSEKGNFQLADFRLSKLDIGNRIASSHFKTFCAPEVLKQCMDDFIDIEPYTPDDHSHTDFNFGTPTDDRQSSSKQDAIRNRMTVSADIYPFGIIMYELMTCEVPYVALIKQNKKARRMAEIIYQHNLRPIDIDDNYYASLDVPERYTCLMKRCWDETPERRPESYTEIISELLSIKRMIQEKPRVMNTSEESKSVQVLSSDSRAEKKLGLADSPLPFQYYLNMWRHFNQPKPLPANDQAVVLNRIISLFAEEELHWYDSVTIMDSHENIQSSIKKNIDMMILSKNMIHFVQKPLSHQEYSLFHTTINFGSTNAPMYSIAVLHSFYDPSSIVILFKKQSEIDATLEWIQLRIKKPSTGSDPISQIQQSKTELFRRLQLLCSSVTIRSVANTTSELIVCISKNELCPTNTLTDIQSMVRINHRTDYENLAGRPDMNYYTAAIGSVLFKMGDKQIHLTDRVTIGELNRLKIVEKGKRVSSLSSLSDIDASSISVERIIALNPFLYEDQFILVISDVALYLFHDSSLNFVQDFIKYGNIYSYYRRVPLDKISKVLLSDSSVTTMIIKLSDLTVQGNMTTDIYVKKSYHTNEITQNLKELIPNLTVSKVKNPETHLQYIMDVQSLQTFPEVTVALYSSLASKYLEQLHQPSAQNNQRESVVRELAQAIGIIQHVIYLSTVAVEYQEEYLYVLFSQPEYVLKLNNLQKDVYDEALQVLEIVQEQQCLVDKLQYAIDTKNISQLLDIEALINTRYHYKSKSSHMTITPVLRDFLAGNKRRINILKNDHICYLGSKILMVTWMKQHNTIDSNDEETRQILQSYEYQHLYTTILRLEKLSGEMLGKWQKLCQSVGKVEIAHELKDFMNKHGLTS